MNNLTPIQGKVLEYLVREVQQRALPPTHREISAAFSWRSNAAAKCHLLALEKKGFIRTRMRISRGIELRTTALDWVREKAVAPGAGQETP